MAQKLEPKIVYSIDLSIYGIELDRLLDAFTQLILDIQRSGGIVSGGVSINENDDAS